MSEFLITDTKEIALITVKNLPNNIFYIPKLLNMLKEENIELFSFSKQYGLDKRTSVSFTIKENSISRLFNVIRKIKSFIPEISTEISGNNSRVKLLLDKPENKFTELLNIFLRASTIKTNIHILNIGEKDIEILIPYESLDEFLKVDIR